MIETAMVFDHDGHVLAWHKPDGATGGSIPDTRSLWDVLWDARGELGGVAHTHPWAGDARASQEDVTTFAAIDRALGRALIWPVVTLTDIAYYQRPNTLKDGDRTLPWLDWPPIFCDLAHWNRAIDELREVSRGRRSIDPDGLRTIECHVQ